MQVIKMNLLDKETEHGFMPAMTGYIVDGNPNEPETRPAVVITPGGGYWAVTYKEGERIALPYTAAGFHVFIVNYCVFPHKEPLQILNVAKAIELIRENASEWHVDSDKIAVCGFSAGGHLAASISTMWDDKTIFSAKEITTRYLDMLKRTLHQKTSENT